jgi:predicted ribosome quality control (RQC) complex YloA/Tae2 family protein
VSSEVALPELLGARIERVDLPERHLLALTLYDGQQKRVLLVAFGAEQRAVGLADARPRGEPAVGFARRLRVELENGRISAARWLGEEAGRARALELVLSRKDTLSRVVADFDARTPNLLLVDGEGRVLGAADERAARERFGPKRPYRYALGLGRGIPIPSGLDALLAAGARLGSARDESAETRLRSELSQRARAALKRVQRRLDAIRGDVARKADIPRLRAEGNLLLCHLQAIPRGLGELELLDETVDPPVYRTLVLDPARDARANADARFERARKLERGMAIAESRLADAERERTALDALLVALPTAELDALSLLVEPAGLTMPSAAITPARRSRGPQAHVAYRTFLAANGRPILVGKGGADNDTLTLTVARPSDLWLHAREVQGAHVIVPCAKGSPAPAEQVLDAATLAAHFSDARSEASVEIQMADRRHLRKPKGTPPGLVLVDRERVLLLRMEPARLARLLASERREP